MLCLCVVFACFAHVCYICVLNTSCCVLVMWVVCGVCFCVVYVVGSCVMYKCFVYVLWLMCVILFLMCCVHVF